MRVTREKNCYCYTCEKSFHYLGITRHRKMHKDRKEDCTIRYTHGDTYDHKFSKISNKPLKPDGSIPGDEETFNNGEGW